MQLLDRRQKGLELVVIPLESFVEPPPNVYSRLSERRRDAVGSPLIHYIARQTSDVWINVSLLLYCDLIRYFSGVQIIILTFNIQRLY